MGSLLRVVGDEAPVAEGSTSRMEGPLFPLADCASFAGAYRNEARSRACFFSAGIIVKDKKDASSQKGTGDESTTAVPSVKVLHVTGLPRLGNAARWQT